MDYSKNRELNVIGSVMLWFMELTPWSGVTFGNLRYLINSPHFVEFGSNYHFLKNLLIFRDLLHLNPAHCLPSYFFKTHLNIAPPPQSTPTHSIGLLPSGFPVKIFSAFIVSSSLPRKYYVSRGGFTMKLIKLTFHGFSLARTPSKAPGGALNEY
jgi:hypothetical protein